MPSMLRVSTWLSDHVSTGCQDCAVLHHAHLCAAPHLLRHAALVAQRVDGAAGEMLVLCVLCWICTFHTCYILLPRWPPNVWAVLPVRH